MGLRGPLRDPDSVRGQRENAGAEPINPERPVAPAWLTKTELAHFESLVDEAIAAGVALKRLDGHDFANIARLECSLRREKDPNTQARVMRTLLSWKMAAGLPVMARARLGIKNVEKRVSKTAQLLELAKRTS